MVHQTHAPRLLPLLIGFILLPTACSSGGGSDSGSGTDAATAGGGIRLQVLVGQVQIDTGSGFTDAEGGQLLAVGDAVKTDLVTPQARITEPKGIRAARLHLARGRQARRMLLR